MGFNVSETVLTAEQKCAEAERFTAWAWEYLRYVEMRNRHLRIMCGYDTDADYEMRFNPNHDDKGRFTYGSVGGGGNVSAAEVEKRKNIAAKANNLRPKSDYENIERTVVDRSIFDNQTWRENFDRLTDNEDVNNQIRNVAVQMLKHRDGTFYEDMYLINASTGAIEGYNTMSKERLGVKVNSSLKKAFSNPDTDLIGIHNHPLSSIPSLTDLNAIAERNNQSKGIIICHDGTIFTYTKPKSKISEQDYNTALTKYKRYSIMTMEDKGFQDLGNDYGFIFERIEL